MALINVRMEPIFGQLLSDVEQIIIGYDIIGARRVILSNV